MKLLLLPSTWRTVIWLRFESVAPGHYLLSCFAATACTVLAGRGRRLVWRPRHYLLYLVFALQPEAAWLLHQLGGTVVLHQRV